MELAAHGGGHAGRRARAGGRASGGGGPGLCHCHDSMCDAWPCMPDLLYQCRGQQVLRANKLPLASFLFVISCKVHNV